MGGTKKAAAVALCVSLWMAGGSVAAAQDTVITPGEGYSGDVCGNHNNTDYGTHTEDPNNNTVTIEEGVTVTGNNVLGSHYRDTERQENVTGNVVTIKGTVKGLFVIGGESYNGDANGIPSLSAAAAR